MDIPIGAVVKHYSNLPIEEKGNVLTHLLGFVGSLCGVLWLIHHIVRVPDRVFLALGLYGFSLLFLFAASTLYHAAALNQKSFWQKVDHIAIYILIAGTYTPVGLTVLYEKSGPLLLGIVWGLALIGFFYKLFFINRWQGFSLFLYLVMGWLVVFQFSTVWEVFSGQALLYLALGGFFYTFGVVFYRWHQMRFHHVIWHLFVLLGAFFHFVMVVTLFSHAGYLQL